MGTIGFIMPTKDFEAFTTSATANSNTIHCPFCGANNSRDKDYQGQMFCWQCGKVI